MNLIQLIYASAMPETCAYSEIEEILESARRHNVPNQITGFLCFANGWFLQILEGDRKAVSETFCRIAQDPRHTDTVLLDCSPIAARQFSAWTMGYAGETKANRARFLQFSATGHFEPLEMTRENALHLMGALASDAKASERLAAA